MYSSAPKATECNVKELRITASVIGDGCVGKTWLLYHYVNGEAKEEEDEHSYCPTTFNQSSKSSTYLHGNVEHPIFFVLNDTAGQEEYKGLITLSFKELDVFIIVFDLMDPDTLENAMFKWSREIANFLKDEKEKTLRNPLLSWKPPRIVLVGNKLDLRECPTAVRKLRKMNKVPCRKKDGEYAAKQMTEFFRKEGIDLPNEISYVETSATSGRGVMELFDVYVAREALERAREIGFKPEKKKKKSLIASFLGKCFGHGLRDKNDDVDKDTSDGNGKKELKKKDIASKIIEDVSSVEERIVFEPCEERLPAQQPSSVTEVEASTGRELEIEMNNERAYQYQPSYAQCDSPTHQEMVPIPQVQKPKHKPRTIKMNYAKERPQIPTKRKPRTIKMDYTAEPSVIIPKFSKSIPAKSEDLEKVIDSNKQN